MPNNKQITFEDVKKEAKEKYCNCKDLPETCYRAYGCIYHHMGLEDFLKTTLKEIMKNMRGEWAKRIKRVKEETERDRLYNLMNESMEAGYNQCKSEDDGFINNFFKGE